MNNEVNNNVNNTGNPSGINFVQGVPPVNGAPVPPQQPVYQTPVQPPVAPAPEMMAAQPQMPQPAANAPVAPQPVNPQPLEPAPVNYVATPTPVAPAPQSAPVAPTMSTPAPMAPAPEMPVASPQMPGVQPIAPAAPVMPQQPMMAPAPGQMMPGGMPNAVPPMANNANAGVAPEGEKEKLPIVMIIITVLVVVGVAVFLIMYLTGKISFHKKPSNPTPAITEPTTNEVVLADWMNYLLDQKPTEVKINRLIDADNTKSVNITTEQLKSLFTKMKDYSLVKYYSTSRSVANDELQVTYVKDDVTYNFTLSGENITIGDDSNLKTLFENGATDVEDDGQTSRDSEDFNYIIKNINGNIYDEYFSESEEETPSE